MPSPRQLAIVFRRLKAMTGTHRIMEGMLPLLSERGWTINLYSQEWDLWPSFSFPVKTHRIPTRGFSRPCFNVLTRLALRFHSHDIVWGHGDILDQDVLSLHNCIHATHERMGTLISDKGAPPFHQRLLQRQSFRAVVANSNLMKNDLMSRYGIAAEKIHVVYPGYDPTTFSLAQRSSRRRQVRQSMGLPDDVFVLSLITSGDFEKRGVDRFFRIVRRLPLTVRARCVALVVGKEKNLSPYKTMGGAAGLKGVFFQAPRAAVADFYFASDVMLYPAYFEEFGIAVLEAVMAGVPIVTTEDVGAAELIHGAAREGVLPRFDEEEMTSKLEQLINRPDRRQAWVASAQASMAACTWPRYYEGVMEILEEVYRKKSAAPSWRQTG